MAIKPANAVAENATQATAELDHVETSRAAASAAVLEEAPADLAEPALNVEQPASAQPLAAQTGTKAVAAAGTPQGFLKQIMEELEAEGFVGDLDYSSFLNITLNKQIESSEGHELPNSGFLVRLASSKKKYCFRNNNPVEDEVEVAYSYDRNADKDPESPVAKAIAKWREEGLELADVKEYIEVLAMILDDKVEGEQAGELNGKLITIQVPPTSQGRWAGYLTQLKLQKKQISEVITLARRGKKVESGKFPFYPWDFVCKGKIED